MCGITGFTGRERALPFLMKGLERLEYRGYDSAGVTLVGEKLTTIKSKGRLKELASLLETMDTPQLAGIGHTRWATHGVPNNLNAHPHTNEDETIAIVHNGIVENYAPLKEELVGQGYHFQSETDSEIIVLLLDYYYKQTEDMFDALQKTLKRLMGSWALCVVNAKEPETIYCAKKESPMVLGKSAEGAFCASDVAAILDYTKDVYMLNDNETAILTPDSVTVFDMEGKEKPAKFIEFPFDLQSAEKDGYDSFMMKEIHEQPRVIRETLRSRFQGNTIVLDAVEELNIDYSNIHQVYFIGCGTAYHAGLYAQSVFRRYAHIPSFALPASEFRYMDPDIDEHTICIFISQSGETADTLAALKLAKNAGCVTIGVVNVLGSAIARLTDAVLYTAAGMEISVASTKAYTTQIVLLYLLVLYLAERIYGEVPSIDEKIEALKHMESVVEDALKNEDTCRSLAGLLKDQKDAYFIGRQIDYFASLEGALKLKEISYVHADSYYAGELKHGPIALIEKDTVVVAIATQSDIALKTISNIQETVARGAQVILITKNGIEANAFEHVLRIPDTSEELSLIPVAVILQMFAYYTALEKGCEVDKPRNLAKSVTVE